jgi:hypothetical protein
MQLRRLWPALLVVAACGREPNPGSEPAASSAVADAPVVTNPAPSWETLTRWTVSAEPIWEVGGGATPEQQLTAVSGGLILPDGRIAVSSYATHDVRFYDGNGRHVQSAVAAAGVPDLQAPMLTGVFARDSLMVMDPQQRRAFVLTDEGDVVRSFTPAVGDSLELAVVLGVLDNGRVLIYQGPSFSLSAPPTGIRSVPAPIHLASPIGKIEKLLEEFPGGLLSVLVVGARMTASSVPFSPDFFLAARGDLVAAGNSERLDVRFFDQDGNLVRIVRQEREPITVEPGDFDRVKAEALAREGTPEDRSAAEQRYAQMTPRESYPAFAALRLDASQNLWVEEFKTPTKPGSRWQVFDTEGKLAAFVDLPSDVMVLDVSDDAVLGIARSASGDRLRLYRLDRDP